MRVFPAAAALSLVTVLLACPASACRYNVRDVGFVELGERPYALYGYIDNAVPQDVADRLKHGTYAALIDSGIGVEVVNVDRDTGHSALQHIQKLGVASLPAAILVSPDEQLLAVPVSEPGRPFDETIWPALDGILASPTRGELLDALVSSYGVVLLIEGVDESENARVRRVADAAVEKIASHMDSLPKAISKPPAIINIERASLSRERVLLWGLGLDAERTHEPHAAVIYGRARRLGPVLRGDEITEARLTGFLAVVGADCECGLDRSWLRGPVLLVDWDSAIQARVAEALGFDPENPMVKLEVSQILGLSAQTEPTEAGRNKPPGGPLAYQEFPLEALAGLATLEDALPSSQVGEQGPEGAPVAAALPPKAPGPSGRGPWTYVAWAVFGLAIVILLAGFGILIRAERM